MAHDISTGSTSIQFGATLRIGYKLQSSSGPFTYLPYLPSYNELPYTFPLPSAGIYTIEYTQICPNCSMPQYSDPETVDVTTV